MFKYILTRILYFIRALLIISLLAFLVRRGGGGGAVEGGVRGGEGAQGGGM